jgi:hypothetical protein
MAARAGGNLHVGFSFDWADEEDLVRRMDESTVLAKEAKS